MKKLIIFLAFVISANILWAQVNDENSSLSKKEKRKAKSEKEYQVIKEMLQNKSFVLEANFLQDKYGRRVIVNKGLNFVSVDSAEAVIQIGSNYRVGPNGVGGVTAKGRITSWELKENTKNKRFDVRMNVMSQIGIYDIYFSVTSSGKAMAYLTGLTSGHLTFDGDIVPWSETTVYEGSSL